MSVVVDTGQAAGIRNTQAGDKLVLDLVPHRFVTFVNELGGVHTIIVDAEHAAKDAGELLTWFDHTKAAAMVTHGDPSSPLYKTPAEIIRFADEALGFLDRETSGDHGDAAAQTQGGGI